MLRQNVKYRSVVYAALFTPPISISRTTATALYGKLAERAFPKLGLEYVPAEQERPLSITMRECGEGRRTDEMKLDIHANTLRAIMQQTWPDSFDVAAKKADEFMQVLDGFLGECEIQLLEARIRAQVPIQGSAAKDYLLDRLMPQERARLVALGPISHLAIRYEVAPAEGEVSGPLCCPGREVTVEPLRQEAGFLYLEVMSNWGRTALWPLASQPGQAELRPGPLGETSNGLPPPSEYLKEVKHYIEDCVCMFLEKPS